MGKGSTSMVFKESGDPKDMNIFGDPFSSINWRGDGFFKVCQDIMNNIHLSGPGWSWPHRFSLRSVEKDLPRCAAVIARRRSLVALLLSVGMRFLLWAQEAPPEQGLRLVGTKLVRDVSCCSVNQ